MATKRQLKTGAGIRKKSGTGKVHILMFGSDSFSIFPSARTRCGMFVGDSRYDQMAIKDVEVIEKCTKEELCGNCASIYATIEVRALTGGV